MGRRGTIHLHSSRLPVRVLSPTRTATSALCVRSVAVGQSYRLVVTHTGAVFSTGSGSYGELGHGGHEAKAELARVVLLQGKRAIYASASGHSLVVTECGEAYSWRFPGDHDLCNCLGHDDDRGCPDILAAPSRVASFYD
jgi:alpha-tubulin suppressor-like RCC1 family protein